MEKNKFRSSVITTGRDILLSALAVGAVTAACLPVAPWIGYQSIGLIFLMVIAALSLVLGRFAVFFAALLSSACWNFFFIPPLYTFHISHIHDLISLFANLIVALVGVTLITRIRRSQLELRESKEQVALLNTFLESLNNAASIKDVVRKVQSSFRENFHTEIVIYLKEKKGTSLSPKAFGAPGHFSCSPFEAALQVFRDPSRSDDLMYPLKEPRGVLGVLCLFYKEGTDPEPRHKLLIPLFVAQVASALEREISIDLAKEQELYAESEKLFQTILNSVSHELRTPIAIMSSAISNLEDPKTSARQENRKRIIGELDNALKRMNYLVENILDMSRIDSGRLNLNLQTCDLTDLAGHVVHAMRQEYPDHHLKITISDNPPLLRGDVTLLHQALVNIIHNAVTYSPAGSHIRVEIRAKSSHIELSVDDDGPGVPASALGSLFDKFYRVPGSPSGGTGLGLTISRAIVEAHHGSIRAENVPEGGLSVIISLPSVTGHGSE